MALKAEKRTLLVIDDDPDIRDIVDRALRREGHTVLQAGTGEDALVQVSTNRVDALLLDLRMPGMDGFSILETLRRFYSPLELPVIVISASADINDAVTALGQGANDYVEKPFDSRVLRARVQTQLRLKLVVDRLKKKAPERCEQLLQELGLKGGGPTPDALAKILVADDDRETRELLKRRLEQHKFDVVEARDGPDTLSKIGDHHFDLVLLDVNMPGLSGFRTLARIRKHKNPFKLPVVFMTARGEPDDIIRGLELGANDYVSKPLVYPVLTARVRSHILISRFFALLGYAGKGAKAAARKRMPGASSQASRSERSRLKNAVGPPPPVASAKSRRHVSPRHQRAVERLERELAVIHKSSPEVILGIPGRARPELLRQAATRMLTRYEGVLGDRSMPEEAHGMATEIIALIEEAHRRLQQTATDAPTTSYLNVIENAVDARLQRARLLIAQEEWGEVELLLKRAQEVAGEHAGVLALLGWARLHNPGLARIQRMTEARELLERAEQLNPNHYEGQMYLAHLMFIEKRHEEALKRVQRALRIAPEDRPAKRLGRQIKRAMAEG